MVVVLLLLLLLCPRVGGAGGVLSLLLLLANWLSLPGCFLVRAGPCPRAGCRPDICACVVCTCVWFSVSNWGGKAGIEGTTRHSSRKRGTRIIA